MTGRALVVQANALRLPLPDESVDLVVTSPPYFALRAYNAGPGEIGSEATPAAFLEALWAATREMVRVLKPSGSIFVNLGDSYARPGGGADISPRTLPGAGASTRAGVRQPSPTRPGVREKSLLGLPWAYALGATGMLAALTRGLVPVEVLERTFRPHMTQLDLDAAFASLYALGDIGGGPDPPLNLILRAPIVLHKRNSLPESVRDRVRTSDQELLFHLVKSPRYYSAVDELREPHSLAWGPIDRVRGHRNVAPNGTPDGGMVERPNPLGKLPGSVWPMTSEPLRLPAWLGVQHYACVDDQTEILTRRGWLHHDQLQVGDTVAGYNLDTGLAEWTGCHAVHRYQHDGPMVAVEKRDLSMRLTPNHRALAHRHRGRGRVLRPEIVTADQLGPQHFIPRSADWQPDPQAKSIGVELAALCGWVAAEGWYHSISTVYLSQSKTVNPENVERIDALLAGVRRFTPVAAGQRWRHLVGTYRTETPCTWKGRPWVDVQWRLPLGLAQEIRRLMPDKLLTAELANLVEDEAEALLEAFIDGDGHRRGDRIGIYQKHRANLDWLQVIAVRLGYKTTLRQGDGRWVLYLTKGGRPITLRSTNGVNRPIPQEHYRGVVWCPMTGTGTFIARRNGSVFITGNSFPSELPRRCILGWSPPGICLGCGNGRVPVVDRRDVPHWKGGSVTAVSGSGDDGKQGTYGAAGKPRVNTEATILGYACACTPHTDHPGSGESSGPDGRYAAALEDGAYPNTMMALGHAGLAARPKVGPWREWHLDGWKAPPTRPAVVLDPFSGVGTTIGVARQLGRIGIGIDLSHPYCRAAKWRVFDSGNFGKAMARTWAERQGTLA